MDAVNEGDYVALVKVFDPGNMKLVRAIKNKVHYGKLHFDTEPLIGSTYGSIFEIVNELMIPIDQFEGFDNDLSEKVSNNMINFEEKTQFVKEKMIKKKKKANHANVVCVMRPNLVMINEQLYGRDKIGGLRVDVLALLLTSANVQNGSRCLLLDHNLGPITGALMSRILPDGICVQIVHDNEMISTTRRTVEMLNIPLEIQRAHLFAITMKDFYKVSSEQSDFEYQKQIFDERSQILRSKCLPHYIRDDESCDRKVSNNDEQDLIRKDLNRELRNQDRNRAREILKIDSLDSLILMVQNDHPLTILKLGYKFLAPSGQFVIYSDTSEPLLECYQYLKSNSLAVSLTLAEPWLRKYQVLPDRSRPEMNTTGYSGYLLFGTKKFLVADGNLNSISANSGVIKI